MVQELVQSTKNYDYNRIYNNYKSKYDFIKNYSLIVGTDDETGSDFHTGIKGTSYFITVTIGRILHRQNSY